MRRRPQRESSENSSSHVTSAPLGQRTRGWLLLTSALFDTALLLGCALSPFPNSKAGQTSPPPIQLTVTPGNASLFLGQTQQFQAAVTGTSNAGVAWSVNSAVGGNPAFGTVDNTGLYAAPPILPANPTVTITAASLADPSASASANVTLKDDIAVAISPASAKVPTGTAQVFTATVTGSGAPARAVTWSVNGISGGNASTGTIVASTSDAATYTAPSVPPSPAGVTVTAASVADPAKSGSASIGITCANSVSPASATVSLGQSQTFAASLCSSAGAPITWDVSGITGGNASVGTFGASASAANTVVYTAPSDMPSPDPVTIHAAAGAATASATVTIASGVSVNVSPPSATLSVSQLTAFTAKVTNTPDSAVTWTINGVSNGNLTLGQICIVASNPCVSPNGPTAASIDYVAPANPPATNPVTLTATSKADPSRTGSATVFITAQSGPVSVSVSPSYAFVSPSGASPSTTRFFAMITGTESHEVTWTVRRAVVGQGCGGAACGSVSNDGVYTAPSIAPSPNAVAVTATSMADPTKSATATVAITTGPTIQTLLPSSVMAGAVESFPLELQGVNFVAGNGSTASTIFLNGTPRATVCASSAECVTVLDLPDVQAAATITVQIQNPGTPGPLSNPVPFVIVPFDVSAGTISLTESLPNATSENIIVVDPTTAAASSPINVDFIGLLTGGNTCDIQGSPLTITRPSSGNETVSLCIHGDGLDPTFTYAFTGPDGGDIGVAASSLTGLFPNMIELDLTFSSATLPGVRSLFITTPNNDRAVATGMLEVK